MDAVARNCDRRCAISDDVDRPHVSATVHVDCLLFGRRWQLVEKKEEIFLRDSRGVRDLSFRVLRKLHKLNVEFIRVFELDLYKSLSYRVFLIC